MKKLEECRCMCHIDPHIMHVVACCDGGYHSETNIVKEKLTDSDIYGWLQSQKYQTEYEETGEYKMYFSVDMPKILEDYYKWRLQRD